MHCRFAVPGEFGTASLTLKLGRPIVDTHPPVLYNHYMLFFLAFSPFIFCLYFIFLFFFLTIVDFIDLIIIFKYIGK